MWLLLCNQSDVAALWAYAGLKKRGLAPLEWISSEVLNQNARWEHHVGKEGEDIQIVLADGRKINSDKVRGVLNRLVSVPLEWMSLTHPSDWDYTAQELTAFFTSWLYALPCPIMNRSTPQGLSGQCRHVSEWIWLATEAGLPTSLYRQSSHDASNQFGRSSLVLPGTEVRTILVVANQIFGASIPLELLPACQRLASLARTELLGIDFAIVPEGHWTFAGATPFPDLRLGGEALLDVLVSIFTNKQEVDS